MHLLYNPFLASIAAKHEEESYFKMTIALALIAYFIP